MKISFLFLVYDKIIYEDTWSDFFSQADKAKYSIHIHYKSKDSLGRFKKYCLPDVIETKWADISLVKAQNILLREALKDPENEKFIFVSQACVPVKKFDYIYECLSKNENSVFNERPLEYPPRYKKIKEIAPDYKISKASQWCILNRTHAKILSDKNKTDNRRNHRIFSSVFAPDEIYYLTMLKSLGLDEKITITKDQTYSSTFDNWGPLPKWAADLYGYKGPEYKYPKLDINRVKTYSEITRDEIDDIMKSPSFFARKFNKKCIIFPGRENLENYLKKHLTSADNHL
tara:strand:- start:165 stop:1028 length:864 start_codon:yes stop_codon:yes gene_type:complete